MGTSKPVRLLHRAAYAAELAYERARRVVARPPHRLTVEPYVGHGNSRLVIARGRVLTNAPVVAAVGPESLWRRVRRMVARFATDEVGGITVHAELGGVTATATSDEEGYYTVELHDPALDEDRLFHELGLAVDAPVEGIPVHVGPAEVMTPTTRSRRIVVSDIDDTILQTGAMRAAQVIVKTMTGSVFTRASFPGAAELYAGLARGAGGEDENPFFYVSSSPWNLYGFFVEFLRHTKLPQGALCLRDLGVDDHKFIAESHDQHKRAAIDEILDVHDLPLVLSGDTGQRDPEIYRAVIDDHPDRVEAVMLRAAAGEARNREAEALFARTGVDHVVAADSAQLAAAAEGWGLAPPGWSGRVAQAV